MAETLEEEAQRHFATQRPPTSTELPLRPDYRELPDAGVLPMSARSNPDRNIYRRSADIAR